MKGLKNKKMVNNIEDWRKNIIHPPEGYECISTKEDSREKKILDRLSVPNLVHEIQENINNGKVGCMICYGIVV